MDYKERDGVIVKEESSQDKLLEMLYGNVIGRYLLKALASPPISKAVGAFMDSWVSTFLIDSFVKKNQINMKEFERKKYRSYNQFFTRKIKDGYRPISDDYDELIAPCDGRLSVYPISLDSVYKIKGASYSVETLLQNKKLAKEYASGWCLIFRLTVNDYHRYCYVDDAMKQRNKHIKGRFYTVHPAVLDHENIYKENTREYCVMQTKNFGQVIQVEVGALMVGRIRNYHKEAVVKRGQEKGRFEFGGSTIVLLLKRDEATIDDDILKNTREGYETKVSMGEVIGHTMF